MAARLAGAPGLTQQRRLGLTRRLTRGTRVRLTLGLAMGLAVPLALAGAIISTISAIPDTPVAFGTKTNWFAVRSNDPQAVARAMGLAEPLSSGWSDGITAATEPGAKDPVVFIAPPVGGWVLVVGSSLPYPNHQATRSDGEGQTDERFNHLFTALAVKFPEVQFFGNHRGVGFCAWARARNARIERIFAYADGAVLANVGPQSIEEHALGFLDLSGLTPAAAGEAIFIAAGQRDEREQRLLADGMDHEAVEERLRTQGRAPIPQETDPLDLAGAWSLDPAHLDSMGQPASSGFTARLPPALRQ